MSRMLLCFLACFVLLSATALAQDQTEPAHAQRDRFAAFDKDGSGKVCQEQFMAVMKERAEKLWKKLDPEGKGCITREDFEKTRQKAREHVKQKNSEPQ